PNWRPSESGSYSGRQFVHKKLRAFQLRHRPPQHFAVDTRDLDRKNLKIRPTLNCRKGYEQKFEVCLRSDKARRADESLSKCLRLPVVRSLEKLEEDFDK